MKRYLSIFIALLALAAFGCSKSEEKTQPTTPSAAPAPTATPRAAPSSPTPTSSGSGGILRRLGSDPATLDPHLATDADSSTYIVEIFSGLVTLDRDIKIIPDLAERWDVTQGGRAYTFHLRRDAKFHSGKQVTAQDFKYSLERATDPRLGSPVADTYLGDIVGVRDKLTGKASQVSGVKVIDDFTLEIAIDEPKAYFLAQLTYPTAFVVDRENVERGGRTWFLRPNGTGPFKLKEFALGERLVLEKNANFYRGPVRLDQIVFLIAGGTPIAQYEAGEIDVTGIGLADLSRVLDPRDPLSKERVDAPVRFEVAYLGMNVAMPPFDDVKVRQALAYAIDRASISRDVLSNLLVPATGILPPGFPGFNPNVKSPTFDPQKARQLLAESKYGSASKLPRIVLTTTGTGGSPGLDIEAFVQMWKENLGITVEIQQIEFATFLQEEQRKRLAFFTLGWVADYPDPYDFLDILFYSKSENNHLNYANPEVDRILLQARVEQDPQKRIQLYQQVEQMIIDDVPWILTWYSGAERYALVKPYVKNYYIPPLVIERFKDVYIQK
ncbi:MAG: peptide ABC transporter substrate-binding protein [Chloroflexi bacterium]|nr:peptide ABC transporter substrate-binding protein [Chloroflexota bacterium]